LIYWCNSRPCPQLGQRRPRPRLTPTHIDLSSGNTPSGPVPSSACYRARLFPSNCERSCPTRAHRRPFPSSAGQRLMRFARRQAAGTEPSNSGENLAGRRVHRPPTFGWTMGATTRSMARFAPSLKLRSGLSTRCRVWSWVSTAVELTLQPSGMMARAS
jgi:hypothetical protein